MKKREAMRLVKALRSGEYQQTPDALEINGAFCCLGVACAISKKARRTEDREGIIRYGRRRGDLPRAVKEHFGFASKEGQRRDYGMITIDDGMYMSLADANDCGVPFDQIADYIEANYKDL